MADDVGRFVHSALTETEKISCGLQGQKVIWQTHDNTQAQVFLVIERGISGSEFIRIGERVCCGAGRCIHSEPGPSGGKPAEVWAAQKGVQ